MKTKTGLPAEPLRRELRPAMGAIAPPLGYSLEWGGEYEESSEAWAGICKVFPCCIPGMLPLLADPLFSAMSATIMGGLFVATFLTLIVVPVLYSLFFRIKVDCLPDEP